MATAVKKIKKANRSAAERGRLGGVERKRRLDRKRRRAIAVAAAKARWAKEQVETDES